MLPDVAVIGAGYWGKNLVRNFAQLGALALVCDPDPGACANAVQTIPGVPTGNDFNEVLSNPEIMAVAIAAPAIFHYSLSKGALLAGKDVHVEKPLALKVTGGQELVDLSEPLQAECAHFLDCVRTRRSPRTDGAEGLRVLQVLEAGQRSLDQGGIPVKLAAFTPVTTELPYFVHPTAVIDPPCEIGRGTRIWHFSHILQDCRIGENCTIGQNVVIGPGVSIGNGCKIQNNVSVYKGVTLEDEVFCGPSMVFTNVFNPRAHIGRMAELRPTRVKHGATIGANATILCGITLGRYAFIGAGAVVTKDVPDYALMVGNPARPVGWMCVFGTKLNAQLQCDARGQRFEKQANTNNIAIFEEVIK